MKHHLAILYRTHLRRILAGRKAIECRLGDLGYPPHGQLSTGDMIWLKEVSGPIRAVATATSVRGFDNPSFQAMERIQRQWNSQILAPQAFWRSGRRVKAATLIWLGNVCPLTPFRIEKKDRRSWVVLDRPPVPGQPIVASREPTLCVLTKVRP